MYYRVSIRKQVVRMQKMKKIIVGPGEGVMIDRCTKGHGLWFDGGELDTTVELLQASDSTGEKAQQVGSFLKDVLLGEKESE